MRRRSFLAALFAAPIVPAVTTLSEAVEAQAARRVAADDKLALKVGHIGQVRAGRLVSSSGGLVIDLSAGEMTLKA